MKNFFEKYPLFIILLPVFFLLHLLTDYFRVLYFYHLAIPETFWYLGVSAVLFALCCIGNALVRRLSLLVFLLQFIFFFFGPIRGFFEESIAFLGKYMVMFLGIAAVVLFAAVILIRRKKPFANVFLYLNVLFVVFIGYEVVLIVLLHATDGKVRRLTRNYPVSENFKKCDTCSNPDIFYLVFDMYANSKVLNSFWKYDNHQLENFFDSSGFYYAKNSTSNYNYTVFSMGSTLNMDYQEKDLKYTNAFRSSGQLSKFEDNELFRILKKQGYEFHNFSWFHFIDAPAKVVPFVLTEPRDLVAAQTFWFRFKSDVAWNFKMFRTKRAPTDALTPFFLKECEDNLSRVRESYIGIKRISAKQSAKPVFLYAHFLMPHAPFLFDSTGNVKPQVEWLSTKHEDYLEQLKYTNKMIMDLCTTLLRDAQRPRVIIVQSDHGYRNFNSKDDLDYKVEFENLSAFYFPRKNYGALYDSMSSVNTFRALMKSEFGYDVGLLRDTSFYMRLR